MKKLAAKAIGGSGTIRLHEVRQLFRLVGEVRELGSDPERWRPHMIRRIRALFDAEIVVSSEIHFRALGRPSSEGLMRVHDIGWGFDGDNAWKIRTERDERPEAYWVAVLGDSAAALNEPDRLIPVKPTRTIYGGSSFVLSQYPLPHLGAVDQLGLHRGFGAMPFTHVEHRLVRIFHVELGRLWKQDAIRKASDPHNDLPPRLAQTLSALQSGQSEKQVSLQLGISKHTVHNYVKALHQRLGVSSRGELLAKTPRSDGFLPKLSLERPAEEM